jgi:Domain of unknown function (DUF4189)
MRFQGSFSTIVCACALLASATGPSHAVSAFAAGIPDDVAVKGVAVGQAHNYTTQEDAEAEALRQCRTNPDSDDEVHALCKIVDHFDNRCVAVALDPKAGTPGWGWSIADTRNGAKDQALDICRQSAGADRAPYCIVSTEACDGTAR